jgi:hypothetical protein
VIDDDELLRQVTCLVADNPVYLSAAQIADELGARVLPVRLALDEAEQRGWVRETRLSEFRSGHWMPTGAGCALAVRSAKASA